MQRQELTINEAVDSRTGLPIPKSASNNDAQSVLEEESVLRMPTINYDEISGLSRKKVQQVKQEQHNVFQRGSGLTQNAPPDTAPLVVPSLFD